MSTVLELRNLRVVASRGADEQILVHDVSLSLKTGEALGLVGESGSGKTMTLRAIAGLLSPDLSASGELLSDGDNFANQSSTQLDQFRTSQIGMIFQSPRAHVNPLRTIGDFMTEALVSVDGVKPQVAWERAVALLDEVGISDPKMRMRQRPGQLSGGLLQRVMIAAALAREPRILLADEITTALDVTTQEEVMALIGDLRKDRNLAMLFVTHDLVLGQAVCDRISVMKDGRTIETHSSGRLREDARDPYTVQLLSAVVNEGEMSSPTHDDDEIPLMTVTDLCKSFTVKAATGWRRQRLTAVEGLSFRLAPGQSLGIVGESGSGKSTTARIICGLERADSGIVTVNGESWAKPPSRARARRMRAKAVQMVFQDPYQSLDPRQTVRQSLIGAIRVHHKVSQGVADERVAELMQSVQLSAELLDYRPRQLSGGQRQRVAIARALAAEPSVILLDEAVSALDVTTAIEVLSLLDRIRRERDVALVMISHDLNVVRRLCDHMLVMRDGCVVEAGSIDEVLDHPRHEYTRVLLESVPRLGWVPRRRKSLPTPS